MNAVQQINALKKQIEDLSGQLQNNQKYYDDKIGEFQKYLEILLKSHLDLQKRLKSIEATLNPIDTNKECSK